MSIDTPPILSLAEPAPAWEPESGAPGRKRLRIWELESSIHCAVIGTCLSIEDLRRFARRMDLNRVAAAEEFELHTYFVGSMHVANPLSRLVDKHLTTQADGACRQLDRAPDAAARQAVWDGLMAAGRVGPAFWAFMTAASVDEAMKRRLYGEIHMMSHLHGQAVHLVRRNASEMERRVQALEERLRRDRRTHDEDLRERDRRIEDLTQAARSRPGCPLGLAPTVGEGGIRRDRSREARRLGALRALVAQRNDALAAASAEIAELKKRLADLAETRASLSAAPAPRPEEAVAAARFRRIGYVGGRAGVVARLRLLAAERALELDHHDGGVEDNFHRLECLVTGADCLMCPIDCISHAACRVVKELCQKQSKPFIPLRNSSMACFERALCEHVAGHG